MSRRRPENKPKQFRPRMIFIRTTVALHNAAKEVAARLRVSLSVLAEDSLSRLVKLHNTEKPRTIVAQTTVALHQAAQEVAARLNLSLDQFLEDALLTAVELHNPTQGTDRDVNEKTSRQKTGGETQGQGSR